MAWEASNAQPVPDLLGDTAGYNLLRVGEKFLAVAKSLGPTNVLVERLGERELSPRIAHRVKHLKRLAIRQLR